MCFSKKKSKMSNNLILKERIIKKLNSCIVLDGEVPSPYVSYAKNYINKLFGYTINMYKDLRIELSTQRGIDFSKINEWCSEYEVFTKESIRKFNELSRDLDFLSVDTSNYVREIINGNNLHITRLVNLISEQLNSDVYNPIFGMVFIVHGHNLELRDYINVKLKKNGFNPVILNEEIVTGKTVLEKFAMYARKSSKAIIFMTEDDKIINKDKEYYQARPNVFLELGYFLAIMEPQDIIIVRENEARIPSDIGGVIYENYNGDKVKLFKRILIALKK